jgi:tetrahydromethanopterin S-methyltransferase subunit A
MNLVRDLQSLLRRGFGRRRDDDSWPFIAGKYKVVDATAPVVVVMTDAEDLGGDVASLAAQGLCMVAPSCRSAADAAKLVKNIAANLAVHYVLFAGAKSQQSTVIEALQATLGGREAESDETAAAASQLRAKLDTVDIDALLRQVKPVDMLGCDEVDKIIARIGELAAESPRPNTGFRAPGRDEAPGVERVIAASHIAYDPQIDKAGGYVIRIDDSRIIVEHYNSKRELLRVVEGKTARDLCITLIRNGWVSKLDHAAYLGRELTLAEAALQSGLPYVQDSDAALAHGDTPH